MIFIWIVLGSVGVYIGGTIILARAYARHENKRLNEQEWGIILWWPIVLTALAVCYPFVGITYITRKVKDGMVFLGTPADLRPGYLPKRKE